ncbi:hypothetical protein PBRA_009059 [Plasmodiophora brassicae]|uniref:Phospholipase A2 domain-containing protein n=1 Tax=Plasmodiophora brassicae TaxID=37360 RepID=A0A0G4J4G5_PLABS|nr:hypothetical protein PBRA_009059 [Plasmodiophora brassicae]
MVVRPATRSTRARPAVRHVRLWRCRTVARVRPDVRVAVWAGPARRHRPSSNGCGAMGVTVSFSGFDLEPCCNEHDICYDTCGSNRDQCDATFASCLRRACQALPDEEGGRGGRGQCTGVANLFVSATKLSGCAPFIEAQTRACDCTERDL